MFFQPITLTFSFDERTFRTLKDLPFPSDNVASDTDEVSSRLAARAVGE